MPNATDASAKKVTVESSHLVSKLPCEKYVRFVNPNESDFHDYVRIDKDIPRFRWTKHQKLMVDAAIRTIAISAPGLLKRAMNGAPIPLIVMGNLDGAWMETDASDINITLDAFKVSRVFFLGMLLHEIVHVVDSGVGYSELRQWNDLIVPQIRTYRTKFPTPFKVGDLPSKPERVLLERLNLPSIYVVEGSDEALAECVSLTVQGKYHPQTAIKNFIWRYFLSVPSCIDVPQELQVEAEKEYSRGDYQAATTTITKLLRLHPTARAYFLQGDVWSAQNEPELAHAEYVQAMNCMKAGHVPEFEAIYSVLQENLSNM